MTDHNCLQHRPDLPNGNRNRTKEIVQNHNKFRSKPKTAYKSIKQSFCRLLSFFFQYFHIPRNTDFSSLQGKRENLFYKSKVKMWCLRSQGIRLSSVGIYVKNMHEVRRLKLTICEIFMKMSLKIFCSA